MRRFGLTLIELLIVIGIIVVLAGIIWVISFPIRGKAREVVCRGNLKNLLHALQMYRQDWDGIDPEIGRYLQCYEVGFPPKYCALVPSLITYGATRQNMICPSDSLIAGKPWWEPFPEEYSYYLSYPTAWWPYRKELHDEACYNPPFPEVIAHRGMEFPIWYCYWHALERREYPYRVLVIRLNGQLTTTLKTYDMEDYEL